jgi:tetratricopeptide (TPR) repeat protein
MGPMNSAGMLLGKSSSAAPQMTGMNMDLFESKLKAARTYIDQGNYEQAIVLLQKAEKQSKTAKLYEYFGDAYAADRRYADAVRSYQNAFKLYLAAKKTEEATRTLNTLKYYQTDKTKAINKKFEKSLRSL